MFVIDNNDAIRGIAEVIEKLDFTVHGTVANVPVQLADGQMHNAEADLYASGADATMVTLITITNTDSVARTFTLYLKPSAGTSRAISPVSLDLGVGHSFKTDGQRMVVMDAAGRVLMTAMAAAHKDTHDPQDGSDPLDCAATGAIDESASDEGSAHSFARSDHAHQHTAALHENGGGAEISLAGLDGEGAELTTHKANTTTAHGAVSAATASKHVVRDASARAKFAAPGASGDALIKGTRVTTAELPAMTDEFIWVGTGTNVEERAVPAGVGVEATVALFQAIAATGTFATDPQNINSNNTATWARANGVNQYAEVDYGKVVAILRWQQFGKTTNSGDGVWKIRYYNLASHAWVDWVTGISVRKTADWSGLSTETEVITDRIRLVCTTVDSSLSYIAELEVIY